MAKSLLPLLLLITCTIRLFATDSAQRPNVLMICVDDLHPYVMKGYFPHIQTPGFDKLKSEGVYFSNAAVNTPVCNPSRSSFFSGLHPHTTGAYFNGSDGWNRSEILQKIRNIPEHFRDQGYVTWGAGKILHNPLSEEREADMWDNFPVYKGGFGPFGRTPDVQYGNHFRSIVPWTGPDSDFPDNKNAEGAITFLQEEHDKPFFLYYGLWRPHSPYTAPKRFFDLYNEEDFDFPEGRVEDDLDDLPQLAKYLTGTIDRYWRDGVPHEVVLKRFLYAYAANTSFTDYNVGRVIEALDKSPYADNTIVIFFSDNGFHTTEKERWGKATLWELSANISMIVRTPGMQARESQATISLVDLYPTLVDYCGIEYPEHALDGLSFSSLLSDATIQWQRPSFTSYGINYSSVRSEDYRYIQYPDGTEELYRYPQDPHDTHNLANDPLYQSIKDALKIHIPENWADSLGGRLEIPVDFDKVMRPRSKWDHLPHNS